MSVTVSDKILGEIGRITVLQSHIETQLALFVRELLSLDEERGNIVTSRMRLGELSEVLRLLFINSLGNGSPCMARFDKFIKDLNDCRRRRNEIVHSVWSFGCDLKDESATRSKVKKNKRESVSMMLSDLQALSKEMEQLEWEAGDLRIKWVSTK